MKSATVRSSHLTENKFDGWRYWRQAECRTAGFSSLDVLAMASTSCAAASDEHVAAQDAVAAAWDGLRRRAKTAIREALAAQRGNLSSTEAQAQIKALRAAVKRIDRRSVDVELSTVADPQEIAALVKLESAASAATRDYRRAFAETARATRERARIHAAEPRFREAIAWQNLPLASTSLQSFVSGEGKESALRRTEAAVAAYLQRYCTKNDTIGFFGPVGWATLDDEKPKVTLEVGATLLKQRTVFFEDWAIRAFARHLAAQAHMRPWLRPRRVGYLRMRGARGHLPANAIVDFSAEEAAVLALCNGVLTTREIARVLEQHPFLDFDDEPMVTGILAALAEAGRIDWNFDVPVGEVWPERHLKAQLMAIDVDTLKARALADLDALLGARDEVAAAAGDPDRLAQAMLALNNRFESLCATSSMRKAGVTYGARSLLYEDCVREIELDVGQNVLDALRGPLGLVLDSARWFCSELARTVEEQCHLIFSRHVERADGGADASIDLSAFWLQAQELFFGEELPRVQRVCNALTQRWHALLPCQEGARVADFDSASMRASVGEAFQAADCGWSSGCHQSPDVLVCARSVDALNAGDFTFVLGEVHAGVNTLLNHSAYQHHPDPPALLRWLAADLAHQRFIPLLSRDGAQQPIRVQVVTDPSRDTELCFSADARPLDPARAAAIADLRVVCRDGRLEVIDEAGRSCGRLLDVFGEFLSNLAATNFRLLPRLPYTPRISIDRLVVQRETWRFTLESLAFAALPDEEDRFAQCRRWQRQHGLPRWCFVRTPWETKPVYLDFDSPVYVRLLVRQLRHAHEMQASGATEISFSEMLPTHEQLWLTDAEGQAFTSELRIVCVKDEDLPH